MEDQNLQSENAQPTETTDVTVEVSSTWSQPAIENANHITISLPSIDADALDPIINSIEQGTVKVADQEALAHWETVLQGSTAAQPYPPKFGMAFMNVPKARYTNRPTHGGKALIPQRLRSAMPSDGDEPVVEVGSKPVINLMALRGIGSRASQFLPHSGIHLYFQPPDDPSLMELFRQMTEDRAKLGRETYGLSMSNQVAYQTELIVDFAFRYITRASVADSEIPASGSKFDGLRELIDYRDIPFLIQGLALAAYPRGFNYARACVTDVTKCMHVMEASMNVLEFAVYNMELFHPDQLAMWANTSIKGVTVKQLEDYRSKFPEHIRRHYIVVDEGQPNEVKVELGFASIEQYLSISKATVNAIVKAVEDVIVNNKDTKARLAEYDRRNRAEAAVMYAHIVKSIQFAGTIINDPDTIVQTLRALTADEVWYEAYFAGVLSYLDQSRVGILAAPAYKCPKCGTDHGKHTVNTYFSDYIPLEAVTLFFDLLFARQARLMERRMYLIED